jgi:hypothetical protein
MPRHTFSAPIVKIGVLRSVIVPAKIVRALGGGTHIAVIARYAGETTRSTLNPAGGGQRRLVLRMDVLRPAHLDAGDALEVSLEASSVSHQQPLPPDLQRALQFRPAAAAALERASPSTWRMIVELLEQARTPETRQRRLEKLVERLAQNTADRATKV